MRLNLFLCLIFMTSCSGVKTLTKQKSQKPENKIQGPIINYPINVQLKPGKVTFVEFDINLPDGKEQLRCKNKLIPFLIVKQKAKLFLAESYFSDLKSYNCSIKDRSKKKDIIALNITISKFPYKKEKLNVPKRRVDIKGKDLKRVIKEKKLKKKIYQKSASYYFFNSPFIAPLSSYITSHYGNKRIFNNKKQSQHLGNDFRAKIGVPIPAANRGKVIFVGDLFFIGKVVVIDHGLEIFSVYGHLSKISVQKGDLINQGDILGLSGMTGRVSGPHLHWGVRIQGHWVDGFSLVEQSRLSSDNER